MRSTFNGVGIRYNGYRFKFTVIGFKYGYNDSGSHGNWIQL